MGAAFKGMWQTLQKQKIQKQVNFIVKLKIKKMNKKLLLGMFAAAGMLLATSCSNDELDVQSGNEVQVTFSLATEGGIATRAISDGTQADKLVYAVYKLNANGEPELQNVVGSNEGGQFVKTDFVSGYNVSLTLAKGQTYQVAFWAQNSACGAYGTSDLKNVTVSYEGFNNDENRDAFFKMVEFEVAGDKTIDVVLKRPFAQVNVGVTAEDWEAAVASGIKVENSSVVIKNVADQINLLTGEVSASAEMENGITYALNAIPANESLMVDVNGDGDKETYNWISMSYILVNDATETDVDNDGTLGDERTTLESLQFTFAPESGNAIVFKEGLNSVPVQRNWRTNILGKILTGDIQFNITIDPVYDGDIIYPEKNTAAQELEFVATFGGSANLTTTADFGGDYLHVQADAIFNMNNNEVKVGVASGYGIFANVAGTTAVINDANIISAGAGINAQNGANVVFNNGNIESHSDTNSGQRYLFYAAQEGTTITINEGSFSFVNIYRKIGYICADLGAIVYVKGGEFGSPCQHPSWKEPIVESREGQVIITGGTFGFNPSAWVAEGYKAVESNGKWYVVANDVTVATTLEDVRDAFAEGGNIVLADGIEFDKIIAIEPGKEVYLNLNGQTITVDENTTSNTLFYVKDGGKLIIDGNGTIDLGNVSTMAVFAPYGELVIENGTFIRNEVTVVTDKTTGLFMGAKTTASNVTINGGYFDGGYYNTDAANIEELLAGTMTLEETTDDIAKRGNSKDANKVRVALKENVSVVLNHSGYGSFKIYGGTFVGANPAWGDEGCMLPKCPQYLRPWSYEQGALLDGQIKYDNKIEVPAGYTITKGATEKGIPTYTVSYSK